MSAFAKQETIKETNIYRFFIEIIIMSINESLCNAHRKLEIYFKKYFPFRNI
jgi:hypothetical protein